MMKSVLRCVVVVGGGKEVVPGGSGSHGLRQEETEDHVGPVLGLPSGPTHTHTHARTNKHTHTPDILPSVHRAISFVLLDQSIHYTILYVRAYIHCILLSLLVCAEVLQVPVYSGQGP